MLSSFKKIVFIILLIVGAILVGYSIPIGIDLISPEGKVETKGKIVEIKDSTAYVEYKNKEQVQKAKLNGYISTFKEGDEIDIRYKVSAPDVADSKIVDYIFLMFPGMGGFLFVTGLAGCLNTVINKGGKKLKDVGEGITARYVGIEQNKKVRINGRNPYQIVCEWINLEDDKKYIFKSENLAHNPQKFIEMKKIRYFDVYTEINNPKKYYMDIEKIKSFTKKEEKNNLETNNKEKLEKSKKEKIPEVKKEVEIPVENNEIKKLVEVEVEVEKKKEKLPKQKKTKGKRVEDSNLKNDEIKEQKDPKVKKEKTNTGKRVEKKSPNKELNKKRKNIDGKKVENKEKTEKSSETVKKVKTDKKANVKGKRVEEKHVKSKKIEKKKDIENT